MFRGVVVRLTLGLVLGSGCALLVPYPGGGDPNDAFSVGGGGGSIDPNSGLPQEPPLDDPAFDPSITVNTDVEKIVAIPGQAFIVDIDFIAPNNNVVGGGIRFEGSTQVQWTLIEELRDQGGGRILFAYAVPGDACDDVPNLCHEIQSEQFAVAANVAPDMDVDGDGEADGEFVVSVPLDVPVVLQCATCESKSCVDALPAGSCIECQQPPVCREYFDLCLAPGQPLAGSDEADLFDPFLGPMGVLWATLAGCMQGEDLCQGGVDKFNTTGECGL